MSKLTCLLAACLLLVACGREAPKPAKANTIEVASPEEGGAVSNAPIEKPAVAKAATAEPPQLDWSPLSLAAGEASLSCELDYASSGDGEALLELDKQALLAAMAPCAERGVIRLRFVGKITSSFTALMQRVVWAADELKIGKRVLDIDSIGGMVEDAMRAGDVIGGSRWTIWVRDGAVCHSACVLLLAGGDIRMISGSVGIHRIIRMNSNATTRVQLNEELRSVYGRVRDYLERNGAATAMADQMMSVPNRNLRLLSSEELQYYGLDGINPVQDDLDRLRLMRKCGEDFVARRDAFIRAFASQCKVAGAELDVMNECGVKLRKTYGFPDKTCAEDSPLAEFDLAAEIEVEAEAAVKPQAQRHVHAGAITGTQAASH